MSMENVGTDVWVWRVNVWSQVRMQKILTREIYLISIGNNTILNAIWYEYAQANFSKTTKLHGPVGKRNL